MRGERMTLIVSGKSIEALNHDSHLAFAVCQVIVEMLDEVAEQLKKDSYSKDYIGGLRHAQHEIKTRSSSESWKKVLTSS